MSARRNVILLLDEQPSQIALIPTSFEEMVQWVARIYNVPFAEIQIATEANGPIAGQAALDKALNQGGPIGLKVKWTVARQAGDYVLGFESVHKLRLLRVSDNSVSTLEFEELNWTGRVCLYDDDGVLFTGGQDCPRGTFVMVISGGTKKMLGDMQEGRVWHGLCAVGRQAFAVGGKEPGQGTSLKTTECLNAGQWTSLASLNFPRESHSMIAHRDILYVVGGFDGTHRLQSVEAYKYKKWVMLPVRLPEPRQMPGLVFLDDNKLMVAGGHNDVRSMTSVFLISLDTGKVEAMAPLPTGDYFTGRQLVKKANGEVWGFGKHDYIYFPDLGMWASTDTNARVSN